MQTELQLAQQLVTKLADAKDDFQEKKSAVMWFISSLSNVQRDQAAFIGDGDLLELAAHALLQRGKNEQLGKTLFLNAYRVVTGKE